VIEGRDCQPTGTLFLVMGSAGLAYHSMSLQLGIGCLTAVHDQE